MTAYTKCHDAHRRGSWWQAGFCASWGQIHSESISLELTSELLVRQGLLALHLSPGRGVTSQPERGQSPQGTAVSPPLPTHEGEEMSPPTCAHVKAPAT